MKYFSDSEFNCPCCGKNHMKPKLMEMLDNARNLAGIPFHINSGFRCPIHNQEVGGSSTSSHLKGYAVDIQAKTDLYRFRVIMGAVLAGFTRIGVGETFVHIDCDPDKNNDRMWDY